MRFEGVWLRYGRRSPWVLQDVEFALEPGQIAVIVGRNGVGKTTLLSAAAGLLRPGRGRVTDPPRRVGWVPERFPADQPFTLRLYLTGMGRAGGLSRTAVAAAIDEWTERLYLTRYLDTKLAQVSKGTAQKVGLVQALLTRPDLLVLDEPWEGLDGPTREQIPAIVDEVRAEGRSVLVSDHLGEVARLGGAVHWRIAEGHLTQVGTADDGLRVIEVGVAAAEVQAVVARLRADGHDILRVRPR